jgi:hypothetical protein
MFLLIASCLLSDSPALIRLRYRGFWQFPSLAAVQGVAGLPDERAGVIEEARQAAARNHPAVVTIFAVLDQRIHPPS